MITFLKSLNKTAVLTMMLTAPLLFSCNDNEKTTNTVEENTPQEITLEQKKQAFDRASPSSNNASGDIALNPPHGQPGHSCEIPVGQPLNRAGNTSPKVNVTPVNKASDAKAPMNTGNVNPPHGQPGHRCDIKVGDPL